MGVDCLLPGEAGGGEQADGACGGEMEVQAGVWAGLPREAEVRGLRVGGVLREAPEGRADHGARGGRGGREAEEGGPHEGLDPGGRRGMTVATTVRMGWEIGFIPHTL